MAFALRCEKCGARYYGGQEHVCCGGPPEKSRPEKLEGHSSTAERRNLAPKVEGSNPSAPATLSNYDRQKRWRERNREAYNAYMREYRKRKK